MITAKPTTPLRRIHLKQCLRAKKVSAEAGPPKRSIRARGPSCQLIAKLFQGGLSASCPPSQPFNSRGVYGRNGFK